MPTVAPCSEYALQPAVAGSVELGPGSKYRASFRLKPLSHFESEDRSRSVVNVVRAWAENHPVTWTVAPTLVQQHPSQGERNRRKLIRLGQVARQRDSNRRELP